MNFVNLKGEPLNICALAGKHKPQAPANTSLKRTDDRTRAKVSDGFVVLGFPRDYLETAEREHNIRREELLALERTNKLGPKEKVPAPWNEEVFMRTGKPKRARTKPYELEAAADECAELCRKAGWKNVRVEELMKG